MPKTIENPSAFKEAKDPYNNIGRKCNILGEPGVWTVSKYFKNPEGGAVYGLVLRNTNIRMLAPLTSMYNLY